MSYRILMLTFLFLGVNVPAQGAKINVSAKAVTKGANMSVKLILEANGEKLSTNVALDSSPAALEFASLLPLSLNFSDYVGKEKISPALSKRFTKQGKSGYIPQIGDLFYFSPWGNLGIFYEAQPPHSGLVFLGKLEDSAFLETLKAQRGDFILHIQGQ